MTPAQGSYGAGVVGVVGPVALSPDDGAVAPCKLTRIETLPLASIALVTVTVWPVAAA